jgi:O-antigen ligase
LNTVKVTDANFAAVERMAHWWAGLRMWEAYPWTGVGLGNYAEAYAAYKVAGWDDPLGHAHNFYINIGAEAGTIGLAAYLVFLVCATTLSVRRALQADNPWDRALAVAVIGVLAARLVQDGLDNLWVHGMGVQIALLLALLESRVRPA